MKSINRIVESVVNRYLLKEMMSGIVYHFTHTMSLRKILKSNRIRMSDCITSPSDSMHNSKLFYLSTTRQYNGKVGFSSGLEVRIELDGDLLNQRYEGKSVEYWGRGRAGREDSGYIKEYEDRLFSNEPYIENADKYIRRITMYVKYEKDYDIIQECIQLCGNLGIDISVYSNEKDFNNPKSVNTINGEILKMNFPKTENNINPLFAERDIRLLFDIVYFCVLLEDISYFNIGEYAESLGERYGLEIDINRCVDYIQNKMTSYINGLPEISRREMRDSDNYGVYFRILRDVLRKYGLRDVNEANRLWMKRKFAKPADHYENFDTEKTIRLLCWSQGEGQYRAIINPDKTPFWSLFEPYVKERFIEKLTTHDYDYGVRSHKSKDNESFNKYIKHLTMNPRISVSEMLKILDRIDYYEEDIIDEIFWGKFVERDINYWECWKYAYSPEEEKELKELFRK